MSGNFEFMKKYNLQVYKFISEGEKNLKIDVIHSGDFLRKAFEEFVNNLAKGFPEVRKEVETLKGGRTINNIVKIIAFDANNTDQRQRYQVLELKTISTNELYNCKKDAKICNRKIESDKNFVRKIINYDADFIRIVGNNSVHTDKSERVFKINYENVRDAYIYFHNMLLRHYCKSNTIPTFKEELIPIGDFSIIKSYMPSDRDRTKCRREYIGKHIENERFPDEGAQWAIIREYRKEKLDENFLLRGYDTQILADKDLSGIPVGMTRIKPITNYFDKNSPFYIIAYIFQRKPVPLVDVIENLSENNRFSVAIRIADCFKNLHNSKSPIYHRMFNYNCVYLCDYSDIPNYGEWIPAVIKFDFSKINDQRVETVFDAANTALEKLDIKEAKYISKEWKDNPTRSNWEKVDIFSLGVLFADIFSGKILDIGNIKEFFNMEDIEDKIDTLILILIDSMVSDDVKSRPSAEEVYRQLVDYRRQCNGTDC